MYSHSSSTCTHYGNSVCNDHCPHAHYGKSLANITVAVASALPYSCVHVDSDHSRPCLTMHGVDSYHMHVATA